MQAYFHMTYIATLLNVCNANDNVHYKINLSSLMKCFCLIIGKDFTAFISGNLVLQIPVD